ncbi:conserved exported protein of unknown function [Magnetospirillum gryphiswaldense MSR-1 v2]|uniref:Secreted protein n=1 Tax=Magnetospirillum gryphiswaldense (strain DSM 6361 / JCM 21280 / NBRC 15271 / MSR-1) TaxID=431944 RepID=V6F6L1_MAGGM|nr:hypothetical protein [Magnetospirillum gryphiswaldense]CDL00128.1 conserved exported protein of unknown function [Magnetospirillum gryphiswaldense MSR-1 v2]
MRPLVLAVAALLLPLSALASERLQVPQLSDWKVMSSVTDKTGQSTELIPVQEGAETWTRRITVQAFRGVPLTVSEFLEQAVAKTAPVCEAAAAGPASIGSIGGREAGSRTIACGKYKGDGRGTYVLHFAIRGRDAFYVVSRMWRGAPFALGQVPVPESELVQWRAYADAIDLCDTTDARRPCRD